MIARRDRGLEALLAPPKSRPIWMVSFIDTLSLVLSFFILLFSMATPDVERFRQLTATLTHSLGTAGLRLESAPSPGVIAPTAERTQALNLDYLASLLQAQVAREPSLSRVVLQRLADRLVLTLPSDVVFASNQATLTPTAERALFELCALLARLDNRIDVQGHTDPAPIAGGPYGDNWELSIARAVAVRDVLRRSGYQRALVAQGLADTRFAEISGDIPAVLRRQLARRVDVVIYPAAGARS
ncbi:MAG: flagellar motor protein MotB [Proteobacteria bacterium]|nr:flagellar motor protein MotB [Pseudomonadota bacterium]